MKKLTTRIFSPYLPYDLKINIEYPNGSVAYGQILGCGWLSQFEEGKTNIVPRFRPLSDLTREITIDGKTFVPIDKLEEMYGQTLAKNEAEHLIQPITCEPYILVRQLFEWHFDVFNLIPIGLAIKLGQ